MSEYRVDIEWACGEADFLANKYSRRHRIRFDGGTEIAASSSPAVVPEPLSDASAIDPEEAFVAAVASCHMLWFLSLARDAGHSISRYTDSPVGVLSRNNAGRIAMTRVTLRPVVEGRDGESLSEPILDALHSEAHARCFIANSVLTEIRIESPALA